MVADACLKTGCRVSGPGMWRHEAAEIAAELCLRSALPLIRKRQRHTQRLRTGGASGAAQAFA